MIVFSTIFLLCALISCIGAGYIAWAIVIRSLIVNSNQSHYPSSIELGFVGMLVISIFATLLNFVVPISQWLSFYILATFFIAGVANLFLLHKCDRLKLLALGTLILVFAFWGSKFIIAYDAGLYHLQVINWIKDEPIVLGLANIHSRFGFNSLWLSALAMFWIPGFQTNGMFLANYLPAILLTFILVNHLLDSQKTHHANITVSTIFAILCLAGVSAVPYLLLTHTTSTDLVPNVCTLLSAFIFLRGVEIQKASVTETTTNHMMLWLIALFALLTKLSAIAPGLLALIFTIWHKDILGNSTIKRTVYLLSAVAGIWLLRNFLISGCLIFPVGFTCANPEFIDWSIGAEFADQTRTIVERWAKAPGVGYLVNGATNQWIDNWLLNPDRGGLIVKIAWGVSISGLLAFLLMFLFTKEFSGEPKQSNKRAVAGTLFVMLVIIVNILFGFMSAPDPSFWWGPLVMLFVMPIVILAYIFFQHLVLMGSRLIFAIFILAVVPTGNYVLASGPIWEIIAQPFGPSHTVIPDSRTELVIVNGIVIHIPVDDDRCWQATKPCTPNKPDGLNHYKKGRYSVFTREFN